MALSTRHIPLGITKVDRKRGWFLTRRAYGDEISHYFETCRRFHQACIVVAQRRTRCIVEWRTGSLVADDQPSPKVTEAFLERVLETGVMLQSRCHSSNRLITLGPTSGTVHGLLFDDARVLADWLATSLRRPATYEPHSRERLFPNRREGQ